jgi:hypothetical protein
MVVPRPSGQELNVASPIFRCQLRGTQATTRAKQNQQNGENNDQFCSTLFPDITTFIFHSLQSFRFFLTKISKAARYKPSQEAIG